MNTVVIDGKLEFISKESLQNIVENQQKQDQQNKKKVSFNQQQQHQYPSQNIQQPQISKNSYIYNKLFKDYKEPSLIQNEEPVRPLTKNELIKQLIINKVNAINERNRLAQIKSTKLLFNNNNNRNIIINSNPNPNAMNRLFNFR
jgi:predicted SAM-dependent methyltransferase